MLDSVKLVIVWICGYVEAGYGYIGRWGGTWGGMDMVIRGDCGYGICDGRLDM